MSPHHGYAQSKHTALKSINLWLNWFPRLRLSARYSPGQLLLRYFSLRFMLLVQFVQQWISVWWTSVNQWLHSLFCCFSVLHHIDSRVRWGEREIKCLLYYLIYQKAEAISTRVGWWIVFSMNRTVTHMYWFLWIHFGVPVWQVVLIGGHRLLWTLLRWSVFITQTVESSHHQSIQLQDKVLVHPHWHQLSKFSPALNHRQVWWKGDIKCCSVSEHCFSSQKK